LRRRLGAPRVAAEPGAVGALIGLCARLPLALAISAARAAARPGLSLEDLAGELASAASRLDALDGGDAAASVRAVLSWSHDQLSVSAARMFRLLGLHPGPDISVAAAASLAGVPVTQARQALAELTAVSLLAEHAPGRYAFHDLLRAYATEQARAIDDEQARNAAVGRILDHYLHTARTAAGLINPARDPIPLASPRPGVVPEQLADARQAMAWFEAEHEILAATVALADSSGFDIHAWQIPWALPDFLWLRGHWHQLAVIQRTAVAASTRLGEPAVQAMSLRLLADTCSQLGEHDQALTHFATALGLYQQLGDGLGEARTLRFLAMAAADQGRYADALSQAEEPRGCIRSSAAVRGRGVG
jgi:tetratricopeptide (TPR) repeat protein